MRNKRQSTRSALALARTALQVANAALPAYSSPFSKRDFTQPQLFALLCLKQFLRQDYRGLVALLADWSDLRRALRLRKVPHYSTLAYAARRLGQSAHFRKLWAATFAEARHLGLVAARPEIAVDATGLESRHTSRYYVTMCGAATNGTLGNTIPSSRWPATPARI